MCEAPADRLRLCGWLILCRAGRFDSKRLVPMATVAVGGILMALTLANAFGQVFAGTR
jgi:hypothetical protein